MTTFSQNGYVANDISLTQVWTIPGTSRTIRLKRGAVGEVLVDLASWFDRAIEPIDEGQLDDWGYAERNVRGSDDVVSNHASGTAMDLNALKHPLGARGTFSKAKTALIRARLDQHYEGVIRWGGDYQNRPDEMHFEIDAPLADVTRVAQKLRKDWLAMATKEEVREVVREELTRLFGDATNDKNPALPDIGKARVVDPKDGSVWSLGHLLFGILRQTKS